MPHYSPLFEYPDGLRRPILIAYGLRSKTSSTGMAAMPWHLTSVRNTANHWLFQTMTDSGLFQQPAVRLHGPGPDTDSDDESELEPEDALEEEEQTLPPESQPRSMPNEGSDSLRGTGGGVNPPFP